jgi:endonuclease/exonuclease/phosphatase (EEP) superfamily protein YafD
MVSRLPLENARALPDDAGLSCMSGVITVAGEKVGILGVHPLPPTSPGYFSEWKASIGSWPSLLRQIPCTHRVLTGDLNSTPFSRAFANLCTDAGLKDSAIGYGLPNTWIPTPLPLGLPLDHVLISKDLMVFSREVGPPAGSDHRWVKVVLTVNK